MAWVRQWEWKGTNGSRGTARDRDPVYVKVGLNWGRERGEDSSNCGKLER